MLVHSSEDLRPTPVAPTPPQVPDDIDPDLDLTDEQLDALTNDPAAKWCSADDVMARLREIDSCTS